VATLRDVAQRAGVSVSVVSAVVSPNRYVRMSQQTRERVLKAIAETNYVPNRAARTLRMARSGVLAVVVPKIGNPIFEDMLAGMQDAAEDLGNQILLAEANRVRPGSDLLSSLQGDGHVDGFLIRPTPTMDATVVHELVPRHVPTVVLDAWEHPEPAWINVDDEGGMRVATRHLIELGHERIGFLGAPVSRRVQGYRTAMDEAGLPIQRSWVITPGFSQDDGMSALTRALTAKRRVTAVVVNNVLTALGVLAAAHDHGVTIPQDLSVVALHDIVLADYARPALTCVRLPMYELGHRGVHALAEFVAGRRPPSGTIAEPAPQIVVRDSAAAP
jgi:DNA-binding LacI/PurR family transcriptional regulator